MVNHCEKQIDFLPNYSFFGSFKKDFGSEMSL